MLKGKKIRKITKELWERSIKATLDGVFELLDSTEKLLDSGGSKAICGGLYTYAVEEYGKSLLLKKCVPANGHVGIKTSWFKGRRAHNEKIECAIHNLPKECRTLSRGLFDPAIFDPEIFDTKKVVADFETRKGVFFMDFSNSYDSIKPVPRVDEELLRNAIEIFRAKVSKSS